MQPVNLKPTVIKARCLPLLVKLIESDKNAWIFKTAVDPVTLNLPDYFDVVKRCFPQPFSQTSHV